MNFARTIRFDESDDRVFARAAEPGEWAIPGGFAFSNFTEDDLADGRQAFAHGWLGLASFGRSTFVAVSRIEPAERAGAVASLAEHFVRIWGAPDPETARKVAEDEVRFMEELCAEHAPNTLLAVSRALTGAGVRESFRAIRPDDAELTQVARHHQPD